MQYAVETELLYRALGTPLGIAVAARDITLARQRLYRAREAAGDKLLGLLQFRISPTSPGELWIVNTTRSAGASDGSQEDA